MKNIKGRMHRKLTTSPTWRNPVSVSPFRPSNLTMSEKPLTVEDEDKLTSFNPIEQPCPKPDIGRKTEHTEISVEKCPPGGREVMVLYTTSLRGIRKTFEDCNTIKFLLGSFRVVYLERDVSMHMEYREELWGILGERVVPPRLFVRGRYVGGADEVVGLHDNGMLQVLLQWIPLAPSARPCGMCGGMRFVLCATCSGSRKIIASDKARTRCPDCNENGLVKCSICV